MRQAAAIISVVLFGMVTPSAQAPSARESAARLAFDVASIKKVEGPAVTTITVGSNAAAGGAFNRITSVANLILYAYDLRDYQLDGGPDWIRRDRFDVAARAGRDVSTADMRSMVQSLLKERFKLIAHHEQRQMPVYTLAVARSDQLGPGLRKSSDAECAKTVQRPSSVPPGAATSTGCGEITLIANLSTRQMGMPVIDRTQLSGKFEWFLYYSQDRGVSVGGRFIPPPPASADPSLPSFSTAMEEQLGLKLQSTRAPVDVLVVDSVQEPTPN